MTWISGLLFLIGASVAARRCRTWVNPFSVPLAVFAVEALLSRLRLLATPWDDYGALSWRTEVFVLAVAAMSLVLVTFLSESRLRGRVRVRFRLPASVIMWGTFLVLGLATASLIVRNGGVPFLEMAESYARGRGTHYDDYDIPFVTPAALGLSRLMFLVLALDLLRFPGGLYSHIWNRKQWYVIAVIGVFFVFASGRRNVFLWPPAFIGLAYVMKGWRPNRKFTVYGSLVLVLLAMLYTWVGNVRLGSDSVLDSPLGHMVVPEVNESWLAGPATAALLYLAPNLSNLDVMIEQGPDPAGGAVLLSEVLPARLVQLFGDEPTNTIEYLQERRLLPFRGFTFRTIFADLMADFPPFPAYLAGMTIFGLFVRIHNQARRKGLALVLYLGFIPGMLMFPLLNQFTGLVTLLPVLLVALLARVTIDQAPLEAELLNPDQDRHAYQQNQEGWEGTGEVEGQGT